MQRLRLICCAACLSAGSAVLTAADFKVIANPSVKVSVLSAEELKEVFLITRTSLGDGSRVEPVLRKEGPLHESFVREYIGKTGRGLEIYYRSLAFTGRGFMPKALDSDSAVADYLVKTKGAVGYVSVNTSTPGLKILDIR